MNNTKEITAADVVAYLKSKAPTDLGVTISVGCCTTYHEHFYASIGGNYEARTQFADTPEEAVALVVGNIKTPARLAASKREAAARLLAEADALAPQVVEVTS